MKLLYLIVLALLNTNLLFAQISFYVSSSNGNDDNNGKSPESAWKTLGKVNSTNFAPGDKILFKKGDLFYGQISFKNSGIESTPITLSSYGDNEDSEPVLTGNQNLAYVLSFQSGVGFYRISNLIFKDFDPAKNMAVIKGATGNHNIEFENCRFSQNKIATNGNSAVMKMNDPHDITINNCDFAGKSQMILFIANSNSNHGDVFNITITNCNFHDINTKIAPSDWGGNSRAIRMYSNHSLGVGHTIGNEGIVRDITINDNIFRNISSIAIWNEPFIEFTSAGLTSYNINISRNVFKKVENCAIDWGPISNRNGKFEWSIWSDNQIDSCGFDLEGNETDDYPTNAIQTHAAKNLYIINNTVTEVGSNSGDGHGIILDYANDSGLYICDSVIVYKNVVSGCTRGSSGSTSGINNFKGKNCLIAYNVCFKNQAGIKAESSNSENNKYVNNVLDDNIYGFYNGCNAPNNLIENNIITNNSNLGIRCQSVERHDYNCFYNNLKNYSGGQPGLNDLNMNPNFIDAFKRNYHLKKGSPCIDKGNNLDEIYEKLNINFTKYNSLDIGAFEYMETEDNYVTINAKVFLEGAYSQGKMTDNYFQNNQIPLTDPYSKATTVKEIPQKIVDWLLIEIRSDSSSSSTILEKTAFLRTDGKIVDLDGNSEITLKNILEGDYYLVIKHRNHLGIMSKSPIHLSESSQVYDFTSNSEMAYGNDAMIKLDDNNWGMYSGDGDSNGIINILDYKSVGNYMFNSGYQSGDFDMNSVVNINDFTNSSVNLFKSSKVPK